MMNGFGARQMLIIVILIVRVEIYAELIFHNSDRPGDNNLHPRIHPDLRTGELVIELDREPNDEIII